VLENDSYATTRTRRPLATEMKAWSHHRERPGGGNGLGKLPRRRAVPAGTGANVLEADLVWK
jgi:hypothetical protein